MSAFRAMQAAQRRIAQASLACGLLFLSLLQMNGRVGVNAEPVVSTQTYVNIYGAPAETKVPVVFGFHTASLASYGASQRSKVRVAATSGFDFSVFQMADIKDLTGWPKIGWVETTSTQVEFFLVDETLRANSAYEMTMLVKTGGSGSLMSALTLSLFTYDGNTKQWLEQETSTENQGRGTYPRQASHLLNAPIRTSSNSLTGSQVAGAWTTSAWITVYLVELRMASLASGIISIMPSPPSAWNFASLGATLIDGMRCPDSTAAGVEGQAVGVRFPTTVAHCYMRSRGQYINSIDLWFVSQDISSSTAVKLYLPQPLTGTFESWYIAYREHQDTPGYLVDVLPLHSEVQPFLRPVPMARILGASSYFPMQNSVIQISFNLGANMAYMTNSRIEFRIDSSVFEIEPEGCQFTSADSAPFGAFLITSNAHNMCTLTWSPIRRGAQVGGASIEVFSDGRVSAMMADFHKQGVVGLNDVSNVGGNSWYYLIAAGTRYIVKNREWNSPPDQLIYVLANTNTGNLRGTNTRFTTGTFEEKLTRGDHVYAGGRTFTVTTVREDTRADVIEAGSVPTQALQSSTFRVRWISKLQVMDFYGNSEVPPAPAGSSFAFEQLAVGAAFWSRTYSLSMLGKNVAANSAEILMRIYSGRDSNSDGKLDYTAASSSGAYRVAYSPRFENVELHPTTVAEGAKARAVLAFMTGTSSRFSGEAGENHQKGMLLRLSTTQTSAFRLHQVDGTDLTNPTTEADAIDCSTLLLEVWSSAATGFPQPAHCWWDSWLSAEPAMYMRLQERNGFSARTRYELVFLASLGKAANNFKTTPGLLALEVLDGDGTTSLNYGTARISRDIVQYSREGQADEPILTSFEILGGADPLQDELKLRFRGGSHVNNKLDKSQRLRVFLFPLTQWTATTCRVRRTDGQPQDTSCTVERISNSADRNGNSLVLGLSANAAPLDDTTTTEFIITGLAIPKSGLFRTELAVEAWYHPRESSRYAASYMTSIDSPLSGPTRFASSPVAGGSGFLAGWSTTVMYASGNRVLLAYRPAATCRSTLSIPCRLVVTAPIGFAVQSAGVLSTTETNRIPGSGHLQLRDQSPSCNQQARTCTFETAPGIVLWSNTQYGLFMVVRNPFMPMAQNSALNAWMVQLSGSGRWASGLREEAAIATMAPESSFPVRGKLRSASVVPGSLTCGASTYFRFQFATDQAVPVGGSMRLESPVGFSFQEVGTTSNECHVLGQVNWPGGATCTAVEGVVTLRLSRILTASTFYAFDLRGRLPSAPSGGSFKLSTAIATTELDVAEHVTWSAQTNANGDLIFGDFFECYPRHIDFLQVTLDDMRPNAVTLRPAIATVLFRWDTMDILESPVDLRVYAPPSYIWQVEDNGNGFNAAPSVLDGVATPVMLFPRRPNGLRPNGAARDDANVLYLMTLQYLEQGVLYGFTAELQVPAATPGTAASREGANAWFVAFGAGLAARFPGQSTSQLLAASRTATIPMEIRVVHGLQLITSTDVPLKKNTATVVFTTVTDLQQNGLLELVLPPEYTFGMHLGKACSADGLRAADFADFHSYAATLPGSANLTCVQASSAGGSTQENSFQWTMGADGLSAGRYVVSVFVLNPPPPEAPSLSSGKFLLRTFSDSTKTVVMDMAGEIEGPVLAVPMPQAELITTYLDSQLPIFDYRPSRSTYLVFAFELSEDLPPEFRIGLRGPNGFRFSPACDVHVGDGSTYSPLGSKLITGPPDAPQYALFPALTNATCTGDGHEAQISISPFGVNRPSRFPALSRRLYLFRVNASNPETTPEINEWKIQVGNQEYGRIQGYNLWEFRDPEVVPSNTAAGEDNKVTIRFITGKRIPNEGTVRIHMPTSFQIRVASGTTSCLDFDGLFNPTILGRHLVPDIVCQGESAQQNTILLSNQGSTLVPGKYEFTCRIRNAAYPLEPYNWQFFSYARGTFTEANLLDSSSVPGFAVNTHLRSFRVEPLPAGQQSSGKSAMLYFQFQLSQQIATGDLINVVGPPEYSFEDRGNPGKCADFLSPTMPPPVCSGHSAEFSFVGTDYDLLPEINPFGSEGSTMIRFQFSVINPPVKPVNNVLNLVHCRRGAASAHAGTCRAGWQAVASVVTALWPIIPQLRHLSMMLLPPYVQAQGQPGLFMLRLVAASGGATKLHVDCKGMDFTGCASDFGGRTATCVGQMGQAMLTLAAGYNIPNGNQVFEINVRRIVNPKEPGPLKLSVTTYDSQDSMIDQTVDHTGYDVARYLHVEPVTVCRAEMMLDPATTQAEKSKCTAENPWYEHIGNAVTLRFGALPADPLMKLGGPSGNGYELIIMPPIGYTFTRTIGRPFEGLTNFPLSADIKYMHLNSSTVGANMTSYGLSDDFLAIQLPYGFPELVPFALKVFVNNPAQNPQRNLWRVLMQDRNATKQIPLYTNDGSFEGFELKGTFQSPGTLTSVQWLVSDFPSEPNVIRLRVSLLSPLEGQSLTMQVIGPAGFVFEAHCLPSEPDVAPKPTFQLQTPWVSSCTAQRNNRNSAVLALQTSLLKNQEYATNLLVTNAAGFEAGATWQLYTFRNGDAFNFVHYTKLPAFRIQVMSASVYPEVKKYGAQGFLHVSLLPMRDLGPFGKVQLNAPEGFQLSCSLRPFFKRGNLPSGASCRGANTFAAVQLSGGDFLEQGTAYHFAVKVINPDRETFVRHHAGGVPIWTVRLQTRDRELVHESTQVPGYMLTERAITRFTIAPSTMLANVQAVLEVQFKLATELLRWRTNLLELTAPNNFGFACAQTLARDEYVTPAGTVLLANAQRFQDLSGVLEAPPTKGLEAYRNDGTTEDGRAIVDCSKPGRLGLALDFTDAKAMGRYAFKVHVMNAMFNPAPNMWTIKSYSDGILLEEGAASGYDVTNDTAFLPAGDEFAGSGSSNLRDDPFASSAHCIRRYVRGLGLILSWYFCFHMSCAT